MTAYLSLIGQMIGGLGAVKAIHRMGDSATWPLVDLAGRPALSLPLTGMSPPRRRFAPAIPPRRPIDRVQLRLQG